jgi:hypothetical protein
MSTNTQRLAGHKLNYSNPVSAFFDIIKNVISDAAKMTSLLPCLSERLCVAMRVATKSL